MVHAGVYSSVLHYLKAVEALGDDDGGAVIAKMKELPTDDPLFGKGSVRADGRKIHDMYLFEVKKPEESSGEWRSEEHTSELQSLMRNSYAVFCLKKKKK